MNQDVFKVSQNRRPLVAIIGRTNVGKSTLFNRLSGSGQALISEIENTTRDHNFAPASWGGRTFFLADTAGLADSKYLRSAKAKSEDAILDKTQKGISKIVKEADMVLFLVDTKAGILPAEKSLAQYLRQRPELAPKIMLVANKADSPKWRSEAATFNRLGLGEPLIISASSGSGLGDLLEEILERFKKLKIKTLKENNDPVEEPIKVCFLGQPNVGKSSLLNAILGYERAIVSPIAHTTREPQDTEITYGKQRIMLVDTAGISKNVHKKESLEKYGAAKSMHALRNSDLALLMLDANDLANHQDTKLAEAAVSNKKSLIILVNKWDLIPKEEQDIKMFTRKVFAKLPFVTYAPLMFICARTGWRVDKVFEKIVEIDAARKRMIPDEELDAFLQRAVKAHLPTKDRGQRYPKLQYLRQVDNCPPTFKLRIGVKQSLHDSYLRFLENRLREEFNLTGTPLVIFIKKTS